MDLGKRLQQVRHQRDLSLRELATLANVSHSFLADIERGRSAPSVDTLVSLAKALHTTVAFLVGESEMLDGANALTSKVGHLPAEAHRLLANFIEFLEYRFGKR